MILILAHLVDSGEEDSVVNEASQQLRPSTSRGTGRVVQFNVRSSGDEEAEESVWPRGSTSRGGRDVTAVTSTDVHAVDSFFPSRYSLHWVMEERLVVNGFIIFSEGVGIWVVTVRFSFFPLRMCLLFQSSRS